MAYQNGSKVHVGYKNKIGTIKDHIVLPHMALEYLVDVEGKLFNCPDLELSLVAIPSDARVTSRAELDVDVNNRGISASLHELLQNYYARYEPNPYGFYSSSFNPWRASTTVNASSSLSGSDE